jgi:ATP-binding cassette subfamily B protein
LSIARALIRNPKLLILDDCLSAVDTETEEIILSNLKESAKSNTCLIVSHRISSLRNADRIIVIEDGRKIEEGAHDQLLAAGGMYAEIYLKQLTEE